MWKKTSIGIFIGRSNNKMAFIGRRKPNGVPRDATYYRLTKASLRRLQRHIWELVAQDKMSISPFITDDLGYNCYFED